MRKQIEKKKFNSHKELWSLMQGKKKKTAFCSLHFTFHLNQNIPVQGIKKKMSFSDKPKCPHIKVHHNRVVGLNNVVHNS